MRALPVFSKETGSYTLSYLKVDLKVNSVTFNVCDTQIFCISCVFCHKRSSWFPWELCNCIPISSEMIVKMINKSCWSVFVVFCLQRPLLFHLLLQKIPWERQFMYFLEHFRGMLIALIMICTLGRSGFKCNSWELLPDTGERQWGSVHKLKSGIYAGIVFLLKKQTQFRHCGSKTLITLFASAIEF